MFPNYKISTHTDDMDVDEIYAYLSVSYWAKGVPKETVKRSIENSLCFGVFHKREQIGFARVITDSATFAYLADVYILEEHRGKGLSKWLMQKIIEHPQLQGLRRVLLATSDAHRLYEKFGFKALANPETFMELWVPNIYTSQRD